MPRASWKVIERTQFYIPEKFEQKKIANCLNLLDKLITLEQEKFHLTKKVFEQITINLCLNCDIPKKEFTLNDILVESNIKTTTNNQHIILSSTTNGIFAQSEYFENQVASSDNIGYKVLKYNQVVFSPQNLWLGNINFNDKFSIGIVSPSYKVFSIDNDFNPKYIAYLLKLPIMMHKYKISSEQGASVVRRNLDLNSFYSIKVLIPDKNIQGKISIFLELFEAKFQKHDFYLTNLLEIKKSLLKLLFI